MIIWDRVNADGSNLPQDSTPILVHWNDGPVRAERLSSEQFSPGIPVEDLIAQRASFTVYNAPEE